MGRARVPILVGLVGAFVLMGVAVFVATLGSGQNSVTPSSSIAVTERPSRAATSSTAAPSASPAVCATVRHPEPAPDEVLVSFGCESVPTELRSVIRLVEDGAGPAERITAAFDALFDGPRPDERRRGYTLMFADEWADLAFSVEVLPDGLALVDFDEAILGFGPPNTSAQLHGLSETMRATGLQFPEVTAIELRVRGSCGAITIWLGEVADCLHFAEPIGAVADCPVVEPASLPNGAPLTATRAYRDLGGLLSWGVGQNAVTLRVSHRSSIGIEVFAESEDAVGMSIGPRDVWAFSAGREIEPGITRPMIAWDDGEGCVYAAYFGPEATLNDLERGASLFVGVNPDRPTVHGYWLFRDGHPEATAAALFFDTFSFAGRSPCVVSIAEVVQADVGDLSINVIGAWEMACTDGVDADEAAFVEALASVTAGNFDADELILSGPDVELRFGR
ncbi:MAG: hypothetical protein ABIP01_02150 [Candidatus Limnocylindria bacterium]